MVIEESCPSQGEVIWKYKRGFVVIWKSSSEEPLISGDPKISFQNFFKDLSNSLQFVQMNASILKIVCSSAVAVLDILGHCLCNTIL